jgi:hypothetical protein
MRITIIPWIVLDTGDALEATDVKLVGCLGDNTVFVYFHLIWKGKRLTDLWEFPISREIKSLTASLTIQGWESNQPVPGLYIDNHVMHITKRDDASLARELECGNLVEIEHQ